MQLRWFIAAAVLVVATTADAYPAFQFSTGNSRCSDCHFSPAGGGLINDWGRSENADTIAGRGDGSFLHGAWTPPDWVQFGADFRFAFLGKDHRDLGSTVAFPMQGDTYVRFAFGDFSAYLAFGPRAAPREAQSALRRMVSREHFVQWNKDSSVVRVGRFNAPFGLRLPDHTVFVRKYTGFHVLEETYNASYSHLGSNTEVHATAFAPADPFTSAGPRESGGVLLAERFIGEGSVAAQIRYGNGESSTRYTGGMYGKYWFEAAKIMALAEVDLIVQDFDFAPGPTRAQLASYVGLNYWPAEGVVVTGAFERFDADLDVQATFRDAYRLEVQYFPAAHFEIQAMGKVETQGTYDESNLLGMLQLHYWL